MRACKGTVTVVAVVAVLLMATEARGGAVGEKKTLRMSRQQGQQQQPHWQPQHQQQLQHPQQHLQLRLPLAPTGSSDLDTIHARLLDVMIPTSPIPNVDSEVCVRWGVPAHTALSPLSGWRALSLPSGLSHSLLRG